MLDLGFPRAFGIATLTLAATLTAGAAQADPPAPPVAPAAAPAQASPPAAPVATKSTPPVGNAPPGYGWAPGGSPEDEPPDVEYPPEMRMRSSGMVAGGVVLLSFGMVGLFAGSTLVGAHTPTSDTPPVLCEFCEGDPGGSGGTTAKDPISPAYKTAGIITLVGSVAALGAGTTLVVLGAKKVPVDDDAAKSAKLTPTVRVGPAGMTLRWQF